jgi:hypothetical protein
MRKGSDIFDKLYDDEERGKNRVAWGHASLHCPAPIPGEPAEPPDTMAALSAALDLFMGTVEERQEELQRSAALEAKMRTLEAKLDALQKGGSIIVPVQSFEPEPYELLKELNIVVEKVDEDEYVASFYDANLNASGCNPGQAVEHLKGLMISRFEILKSTKKKLGRGPMKQLAVLRSFVKRRG